MDPGRHTGRPAGLLGGRHLLPRRLRAGRLGPANPAWGHCNVTALVVQDLLGGDLVLGEVYADGEQRGYHYWNLLPGGIEVDLTREQFQHGESVTTGRVVVRPPGPLPRRQEEYQLFRRRVGERLGLSRWGARSTRSSSHR